jgi:RNA polymerase sigma factor (sigma-70 family)
MSAAPAPPGGAPSVREQTRVKYALHVVERAASQLARRFPGRIKARELYAIGTFALYRAAREFRDEHSHDFADYAYRRVRCAMLDELRLETKQERRRRAAYKGADLFLATYRDDEFNVFLHDDDAEVGRRLQECADDLLAATFAAMVEEAQRADAEDPVDASEEHRRAHEALAGALRVLTEEQREILALVYREQKTLDEAAAALGLTYITTRRRHAGALAALREELRRLGVDRAPPTVG